MSVSIIGQSNELDEDVLLMIFQQLEGEDLLNCEAVCRQWRDILLAETPWRSLFHRKIEISPFWRKAHKKLESNQLTLQTDQYRIVCKDILQEKFNWHVGNFTKFIYKVSHVLKLTIGDDCVAWEPCIGFKSTFLDTEAMEVTKTVTEFSSNNGMLVRGTDTVGTVNIWNPKFNWTINEEEDGFIVSQISCGSGLIVCYYTFRNREERIEVWKMGNPPTLLRTLTCEDRNLRILNVDERFIVARFADESDLYFIFTETLKVFTTLSEMNYQCNLNKGPLKFAFVRGGGIIMDSGCIYDQGLLFQYRGNSLVRILDVASKKYVNNVRIPFRSKDEKFIEFLETWACSNSNVIVIGWKSKNGRVSHLSVYDLEAVKKRNSDPGSHLLYTLQFQFDIHSFVMNESEIAFTGKHDTNGFCVTVLKFANFIFAELKPSDSKETRKGKGYSKKKIAKVEMKKIIGDRVDFEKRRRKIQSS